MSRMFDYIIWFARDPFDENTVVGFEGGLLAENSDEAYRVTMDAFKRDFDVPVEDHPYLMNWYVREVDDA